MEPTQSSGLSKEQKMFALIAEHEASSMTVKDFCELYDLSPGTYHYWQKKYHARLEDKWNGTHYWLYHKWADVRKSFDGLSGLVTNELGMEIQTGDVFIFLNKRQST